MKIKPKISTLIKIIIFFYFMRIYGLIINMLVLLFNPFQYASNMQQILLKTSKQKDGKHIKMKV